MKINVTISFLWFFIIGLWFWSVLVQLDLVSLVIGPLLIGFFLIIIRRQEVKSVNKFYAIASEKMPVLFPRAFAKKTSKKFQEAFTFFVGGMFVLFGIFNLIELWFL
jgi:hypothetical protein